jgi:hypothetical protein
VGFYFLATDSNEGYARMSPIFSRKPHFLHRLVPVLKLPSRGTRAPLPNWATAARVMLDLGRSPRL